MTENIKSNNNSNSKNSNNRPEFNIKLYSGVTLFDDFPDDIDGKDSSGSSNSNGGSFDNLDADEANWSPSDKAKNWFHEYYMSLINYHQQRAARVTEFYVELNDTSASPMSRDEKKAMEVDFYKKETSFLRMNRNTKQYEFEPLFRFTKPNGTVIMPVTPAPKKQPTDTTSPATTTTSTATPSTSTRSPLSLSTSSAYPTTPHNGGSNNLRNLLIGANRSPFNSNENLGTVRFDKNVRFVQDTDSIPTSPPSNDEFDRSNVRRTKSISSMNKSLPTPLKSKSFTMMFNIDNKTKLEQTQKLLEEKEEDTRIAAEIGKTLLEANDELEVEVKTMRQKNNEQSDKLRFALDELDRCKTEMVLLSARLESATRDNVDLELALARQAEEREWRRMESPHNKAQMTKQLHEIEQLKQTLESVHESEDKLRKHRDRLVEQNESLHHSVADLQDMLDDKVDQKEYDAMLVQVKHLREKNRKLRQRLKDSERDTGSFMGEPELIIKSAFQDLIKNEELLMATPKVANLRVIHDAKILLKELEHEVNGNLECSLISSLIKFLERDTNEPQLRLEQSSSSLNESFETGADQEVADPKSALYMLVCVVSIYKYTRYDKQRIENDSNTIDELGSQVEALKRMITNLEFDLGEAKMLNSKLEEDIDLLKTPQPHHMSMADELRSAFQQDDTSKEKLRDEYDSQILQLDQQNLQYALEIESLRQQLANLSAEMNKSIEAKNKEIAELTDQKNAVEQELNKKINEQINQIKQLDESLVQVNQVLLDKEIAIDRFISEIEVKDQALHDKDLQITEKVEQITQKDKQITEKDVQLTEKDTQINEKEEQITERDKQLKEMDVQLTEKHAQIKEKDVQLTEKDTQINEKDVQLTERDKQITEKDVQITEKSEQIIQKDKQITEKDVQLAEKSEQIIEKDKQINEKDVQITEKDKQINEKDVQITEKDTHIKEKDAQLTEKDTQIKEKEEQITKKDELITEKVKEITEKDEQIKVKTIQIGEKDKQIIEKEEQISEKVKQITEKDIKIAEKDAQISEKVIQIVEKDKQITDKDEQITEKNKQLTEKDKQLGEKNKQISEKDEQISKKDKEINEKNKQLNNKDKQISKKDKQIAEKDKQLTEKNKQIAEKDGTIKSINAQIQENSATIKKLNDSIKENEKLIEKLNQKNKENEETIKKLQAEINDKQSQIKTLGETVQVKEETIQAKEESIVQLTAENVSGAKEIKRLKEELEKINMLLSNGASANDADKTLIQQLRREKAELLGEHIISINALNSKLTLYKRDKESMESQRAADNIRINLLEQQLAQLHEEQSKHRQSNKTTLATYDDYTNLQLHRIEQSLDTNITKRLDTFEKSITRAAKVNVSLSNQVVQLTSTNTGLVEKNNSLRQKNDELFDNLEKERENSSALSVENIQLKEQITELIRRLEAKATKHGLAVKELSQQLFDMTELVKKKNIEPPKQEVELVVVPDVEMVKDYSIIEEAPLIKFINEKMSEADDIKHVFPVDCNKHIKVAIYDGVLMCKLVNMAREGTIDERVMNISPQNKIEVDQNFNLVCNSSRAIGCVIQNITPQSVQQDPHITLALIYQLVRVYISSPINLSNYPNLLVFKSSDEDIKHFAAQSSSQLLLRWLLYHLEIKKSKETVEQLILKPTNCIKLLCKLDKELVPPSNESIEANDISIYEWIISETTNRFNIFPWLNVDTLKAKNEKLAYLFIASLFLSEKGIGITIEENETKEVTLLVKEVSDLVDVEGTREERAFCMWINSLNLSPYVNNLQQDLQDGLIILHMFDKINPGSVNWKNVNLHPSNTYMEMENCNLGINVAKKLKFSLVGIDGGDVHKGNRKLTLAVIWQACKYHLLSILKSLRSTSSGGSSLSLSSSASREVGESDIIRWANQKVTTIGKSSGINGFKDASIGNGLFLIDLLESMSKGCINYSIVTSGDTDQNKKLNAQYIINIARKLDCCIFLVWEDIVEVKPKMILTLVAQLYIKSEIDVKK